MKVHIEFDKDSIRVLDALKKQISVKTRTELIKHALAVFNWVVDEVSDGRAIIALREGEPHGRELCLPVLEKVKRLTQLPPTQINCPRCRLTITDGSKFCLHCGADLSPPPSKNEVEAEKPPSLGRGISSEDKHSFEKFVSYHVTLVGECPLCGKGISKDEKFYQCDKCQRNFFCPDHFQAADHVCYDCLASLTAPVEPEGTSINNRDEIASESPTVFMQETISEPNEQVADIREEKQELTKSPVEAPQQEATPQGIQPASAPDESSFDFSASQVSPISQPRAEVSAKVEDIMELPSAEGIVEVANEIITIEESAMVLIDEGEFVMGTNSGFNDEGPEHLVFLSAYYIDLYPVTNRQYRAFLEHTKAPPPNQFWTNPDFNLDEQPVIGLTWHEAKAYCDWVGKRLPSEAEWEKAARGTDARQYPWGNEWASNNCNSMETGLKKTSLVTAYPGGASHYGVMDMAGNTYEWCEDWYDEKYYSYSPSRNPVGPKFGELKILRGGSWNNLPSNIRATFRLKSPPDRSFQTFGFRCVKSAE